MFIVHLLAIDASRQCICLVLSPFDFYYCSFNVKSSVLSFYSTKSACLCQYYFSMYSFRKIKMWKYNLGFLLSMFNASFIYTTLKSSNVYVLLQTCQPFIFPLRISLSFCLCRVSHWKWNKSSRSNPMQRVWLQDSVQEENKEMYPCG